MNKIKQIKVLSIIIFLYISCTHEKTELECATPLTISLRRDVQPIFNQHCNMAGCHSGAQPAGKLNLEASAAYSQLTRSGKGYIDTLNPPYSVLYSAMNARFNPMPPNGMLDVCTIALVLKWIEQKAKNN